MYSDYLAGKFKLGDLIYSRWAVRTIGVAAAATGRGFRKDGSYSYGGDTFDETRELKIALRQVAAGIGIFKHGRAISPDAVENLKALLQACKQRDIYVIGFLPPFTHRFHETLASMPEQYGYLTKIAPALRPAFEETGFGFFDFSDLASVGAPDVEALDPVHPSEKASLRLFMRMAQNNTVLREVTADETYLSARVNQSRSHYEVFGEDRR